MATSKPVSAAKAEVQDPETVRRLRHGTDLLTSATLRRLDAELEWYRSLPAEDRSWIGLMAQSGIASFIRWYEQPSQGAPNAADIFRTAPSELTRSISLQHTVQLIRTVVEVVEQHTDELALPDQSASLRESVLRYSREVAFSAAEVYARAAEARGAWDARLEALVVDALLRGDDDDSIRSRAAALGWAGKGSTVVMVGTVEGDLDELKAAEIRRAARRQTTDALVGIHGNRLVIVVGGEPSARKQAEALVTRFGPGPVVIGPEVPTLAQASGSARAAISGLRAISAWPAAPRPVFADDLLPERILMGDTDARATLLSQVYEPLLGVGGPLMQTLATYVACGRSLEATARELYVHPNTVRYRLRRISAITGWDPTDAREGFVLQVALATGQLARTDAGEDL